MEGIRTFRAGNGEEITIRPAMPDDSCEIIDTIRSRAMERSYVLMEHYGKDTASERAYISGLDRQKNLLIVAEAGAEVIGCLGALQSDAGQREQTAHIVHVGLHLKEAYRGFGIGSQMLGYALEWAQEKGFEKLESSIFTTNKRSLDLFIKAGFKEEGVRRRSIRVGKEYIDEVLMGKVLG
ncbi:MAG: GNAT family N-acetyltransferase [Nitrospirae bacterium]|nr:GNAT family N-acetyltransferase [Nitrospirota bacterium]